ncbi:flavin reductase family protein [Mangrovibrevibacter kandeliae]|uniref:flavin reductase family protein n=1 Tax=Mangrovibrevibacter kandeliae TaxID=2968473 RepID=UPI002117A0FE|nr:MULTISPECIES: flavin reductase family protein [unclassified Aurantimonas]MCQ8781887.1 flavin reductase family protein [Aurantimonas sp. CSK15Z-1]MCW4115455.1 flavin reductase family protein [Aurantimonas sp. MSK8Z-1]
MFYDPRSDEHGLPHNPWTALVTPRPIGWISSRDADGTPNLAPYSFFNAVAGRPPMVMFSSTPRKHSLNNIEATGEFAVNVATWDLREAMNLSSATVEADIDEFRLTGLTTAPCRNIGAPRVAESPISIECTLYQAIPLVPKSGLECSTTLVIGEVVGIHIADAAINEGRVDTTRIRPLARLGYMDYSVTDSVFEMLRPNPDVALAEARRKGWIDAAG